MGLPIKTGTSHRVNTRADNTGQEPMPSALAECLSIDLEVDINTARINALAAWRPDTGERLTTWPPLRTATTEDPDQVRGSAEWLELVAQDLQDPDTPHGGYSLHYYREIKATGSVKWRRVVRGRCPHCGKRQVVTLLAACHLTDMVLQNRILIVSPPRALEVWPESPLSGSALRERDVFQSYTA